MLDTLRGARVPEAITMAGGYAEDVEDIVAIHYATVLAALERFGDIPMLDSAPFPDVLHDPASVR